MYNNRYNYNKKNGSSSGYSLTNMNSTSNTSNASSIDNLIKQARNLRTKMIDEKASKLTSTVVNNTKPKAVAPLGNLNKYKLVNEAKTTVLSSKFKKINSLQTQPILSTQNTQKLNINVILGREVNDLSKNKFKFIKSTTKSKVKNRLKLDNRKLNAKNVSKSQKISLYSNNIYKLSNKNLKNVIYIKGIKYNMNKNGKKLKRLKSNEGNKQFININKFKLINSAINKSSTNYSNKIQLNRSNSVQNVAKLLEKVIARLVYSK